MNRLHRTISTHLAALTLLFGVSVCTAPASAQLHNQLPEEMRGLELEEHLNEQLPLDAVFTNENGEQVTLGSYFDGERPVILMLNYYRCPMLCGIQLNQVLESLNEIDLTMGVEFEIITVSFDPRETHDLAQLKKKNLIGAYKKGDASEGWHFLVGSQRSVDALKDSVGYKVRWLEDRQEWAHGTPIMFIAPDGRISRYLYTMPYPPEDVRLALLESAEGRIGTTVDKFLLWCFHYDSSQGKYTANVMKLVRLCGAIMVAGLGTMLFLLWRRDAMRSPASSADSNEQHAGGNARGGD